MVACEPGTSLVIENQTPDQVTIFHEGIYDSGRFIGFANLGTVPAHQTVDLVRQVVLSPDIAGDIVALEARDASGAVVWGKEWTFDEFLDLEETDWKICVCPETGQ